MIQHNENGLNGNINLKLNFLTLDDIIKRTALNSGLDEESIDKEYDIIKEDYGRRAFGGKVVIVRSDLNSPVRQDEHGQYQIAGAERIEASAPTIDELSGYGAKVVVISHQGTPGREDCISLEPHSVLLKESLEKLGNPLEKIIFGRALWYGTTTEKIIKEEMPDGGIFLLDNIRKMSDEMGPANPEEFAKIPDSYMEIIGNLADFYVNDAFSTSHRWQASIVGFPNLLNIAGRLTEKEIKENSELISSIRHPYTMLMGGIKISGYLDFMEKSLENGLVDHILATGALGILGVLGIRGRRARNYLGRQTVDFLQEKGIHSELNTVTGLARRYDEAFVLPVDFKVELDGEVYNKTVEEIQKHPDKDRMNLYGIGPETVARFNEILGGSKTIYIKGSPTKDDDERFLSESQQLIDSIVQLKKKGATTIVSGGDTNNLVSRLHYFPQTDFTFSTLAGGAATEYHSGILLPGLLMLNTSYNQFNGRTLSEGLENYNFGFKLESPKKPVDLI